MKLKEIIQSDMIFEMPQDIIVQDAYLDGHIIDVIRNNQRDIKHRRGDIYEILFKNNDERLYFFGKINENIILPIAGVYGKVENYDNKRLFRTRATKKYDDTFSRAALKLYSYVSKHHTPWLISDDQPSKESKRFWRKWLLDPKKYGIQEIYVFDTKENKRMVYNNEADLDQFWGLNETFQRYRVIVKF